MAAHGAGLTEQEYYLRRQGGQSWAFTKFNDAEVFEVGLQAMDADGALVKAPAQRLRRGQVSMSEKRPRPG
jgi:hypothetical protein